MKRSLKEVYNFEDEGKAKKLTSEALRDLINEEMSLLREQEEETEKEAGGKIGDAPKNTPVDKSTNVKDVDPVEIVNQLLSGDDDSPIVASTKGKWFETSGAEAKAWVEKIGPETVAQRLGVLASKIPDTGLPKKDMPFLPGPPDAAGSVADVKDALEPGGKYNVDFIEAIARGIDALLTEKVPPPEPNVMTPDTEETEEFMTSGLNDGKPKDDVIAVELGGSIPAADAIPTQSNILIHKALGMAMNPKNQIAGGDLDAYGSIDNEILDGHHRWAATMLNDPGADLGTVARIDLKTLGTKETLKYLTAIGNALGNATKTESVKSGDNLVMERWRRLAGVI